MKKFCLFIAAISLFIACKKNELGGDSVIEGKVFHHSKVITNCSVFIKFKSNDLPGTDTTLYDAKVRVDKDGYYKFTPYKGKYYIYASGKDPGISPPYVVVGGQGVKLRAKETVSLNIYVTEGD